MATYDSLLLSCGGGIISAKTQSEQYKHAASLAIGIGGTGIAALARLKQKVYQQLIPDNPESPIPTYKRIQFLAIDSDPTVSMGRGQGRLEESEFFSIHNANLAAVLATEEGKETIRRDPTLNWMNIDGITALLTPEGAGGVRQIGRYLLINKAKALKTRIQAAATQALTASEGGALDVYIFAGISGGTGSGCFLDTCYIVRKVMEENGWAGAGKIMGFFFLPDVVLSKPEVMGTPGLAEYNKGNGYSAMKELDYLMDLTNADDYFEQNYGAFKIKTQNRPVDMCHLVSATKADGNILENGFSYCMNVSADYVMSYLADVDLGTGGEDEENNGGLTLRGHLANVSNGVSYLSKDHGTNRCYHVVGASNAEIPMTQIATYLAAGFYSRFLNLTERDAIIGKVSKTEVDKLCAELRLKPENVRSRVAEKSPQLLIPEIDMSELAKYGTMPVGKVPECWGTTGNDYLDKCSGRRKQNVTGLGRDLETFNMKAILENNTASYQATIFRKLYDLASSSLYGPYYAALMLHNGGYDIRAYVKGTINTLEQQRNTQELQLHGRTGSDGIEGQIAQASSDFVNANVFNRRRAYTDYKDAVERYYTTTNRVAELNDAIYLMQKLSIALDHLYNAYFEPLVDMLDSLENTFRDNVEYLNTPASDKTASYTWQILKIDDVKPMLNDVIDKLEDRELVDDFVKYLLDNYEEWNGRDEEKIAKCVSIHMENVFKDQMDKTLQDYLKLKYPNAVGEVQLASEIQKNIIQKVYDSATAMFWCDPTFDLQTNTFLSGSLSVPRSASAVTTAADNFANSNTSIAARKTGIKDRIFAMRFFSGVPFYAYKGVELLKDEYDKQAFNGTGAGSHLYAKTGRGEEGDLSGTREWRYFLPTPAPYSWRESLTKDANEKLELYDKGVAEGVIASENGEFYIYTTKELDTKIFTTEDFLVTNSSNQEVFDEHRYAEELAKLEGTLGNMYGEENVTAKYRLKNDGDVSLGAKVVERTRKDYFLHFPLLQNRVKLELAKKTELAKRIENLKAIRSDYEGAAQDLAKFANILFYGIIKSEDFSGEENYIKVKQMYFDYTTKGGYEEREVFSDQNMPFGKTYPLYQAYLRYRELDAERSPRIDMEELLKERELENLRKEDNVIARSLEVEYDGKRMKALKEEVSHKEYGSDVQWFYEGILTEVAKFKAKFSKEGWLRGKNDAKDNVSGGRAQAGTASQQTGGQPTPPPVKYWYIWTGTKMLLVYSTNLNIGYDTQTNAPEPLTITQGMMVSQNNAWVPISFDAYGNPLLP